jgi:hypothetical protein
MDQSWRSSGCIAVVCLAWAGPCFATQSLAALLACRDISDATAQLACFDRETATLMGASVVPAAATPVRPALPLDPEQKFGLSEKAVAAKERVAPSRSADATKIEAHVTGIAQGVSGRTVFTLDNGQVWRQLVPDAELLAKLGDAVTISHGWLGSYWLQLESKRGCKVARVR